MTVNLRERIASMCETRAIGTGARSRRRVAAEEVEVEEVEVEEVEEVEVEVEEVEVEVEEVGGRHGATPQTERRTVEARPRGPDAAAGH